jgi:outer membrane protein assembly factor BamB
MRWQWLMFAIVVFGYGFAAAAEWTEFRGPTGQGLVDSALATQWSKTEHITWKQQIPGKGWSSPVILRGRIYLTTAVPTKDNTSNSLRTLCLDSKTGNTIWDLEIFQQTDPATLKIHSKNSHASSTPITDGQVLFVHFGNSGTACLSLEGKVLWKNNELKFKHVHGNGGSPVLVDDVLVVNCDGGDLAFVAALDRANGHLRWKRDRPANSRQRFAFSTPLVIESKGAKQIVSPGAGAVVAYRPADGEPIWQVMYPGGYSVVPRPVAGHGMVFLSTGYDTPVLLAIKTDGTGDVTESHVAWKQKTAAPRNASPLLIGSELYTVSDNGIAQCMDARKGTTYWKNRLGGDYSASPIAAGGKVYFLDELGNTTVVEASTTFAEVSRNLLGEPSLASPAVDGSSLYLRTQPHLWRIDR